MLQHGAHVETARVLPTDLLVHIAHWPCRVHIHAIFLCCRGVACCKLVMRNAPMALMSFNQIDVIMCTYRTPEAILSL
jgi:hypothetical protein